MKYRSREEIFASILRSAKENKGVAQTKIMYNSFLSYPQLRYYLQYLTNHKLLAYDELNGGYNITVRGLRFLELSNRMTDLSKKTELAVTPSIKWV